MWPSGPTAPTGGPQNANLSGLKLIPIHGILQQEHPFLFRRPPPLTVNVKHPDSRGSAEMKGHGVTIGVSPPGESAPGGADIPLSPSAGTSPERCARVPCPESRTDPEVPRKIQGASRPQKGPARLPLLPSHPQKGPARLPLLPSRPAPARAEGPGSVSRKPSSLNVPPSAFLVSRGRPVPVPPHPRVNRLSADAGHRGPRARAGSRSPRGCPRRGFASAPHF